jgi:hypothetical protein
MTIAAPNGLDIGAVGHSTWITGSRSLATCGAIPRDFPSSDVALRLSK